MLHVRHSTLEPMSFGTFHHLAPASMAPTGRHVVDMKMALGSGSAPACAGTARSRQSGRPSSEDKLF